MLGLGVPHSQAQMDDNVHRVFGSEMGLVAMRFIAFAYTYHYLNWFSKTAIIKWHQVSKSRLRAIGVLWLGCVLLYFYNYAEGVKLLFCLSFLHVFLEFPLNHMSIIGIFKHLAPRPAETPVLRLHGWLSLKSGNEALTRRAQQSADVVVMRGRLAM